jgi:hypothetical protein
MEYGTFTAQTVDEAVALANLFVGPDVGEDELRDVLHLYDLHEDALDMAAFADLAAAVRAVLADDDASRVQRLNDLLEDFAPSPFITEHDGQAPHFHFVSDDGPDVRRVGASLTMALAHVVVDHGAARLGACDAPGCEHVFVDRTRNGNQRFCSKTCATRVHVARHRARS